MTAQSDTPEDRENVTVAQYDSEKPGVFAEHRTGRCESSVVFGQGAEAEVSVDDGQLTLTLTVEGFENPEQLLDKDILSVELAAKNLSHDTDE